MITAKEARKLGEPAVSELEDIHRKITIAAITKKKSITLPLTDDEMDSLIEDEFIISDGPYPATIVNGKLVRVRIISW